MYFVLYMTKYVYNAQFYNVTKIYVLYLLNEPRTTIHEKWKTNYEREVTIF